jgi:hypothetical protein
MDTAAVTAITSAVDFATVITGIGAIGAALVVIAIARKGARALLGMIK